MAQLQGVLVGLAHEEGLVVDEHVLLLRVVPEVARDHLRLLELVSQLWVVVQRRVSEVERVVQLHGREEGLLEISALHAQLERLVLHLLVVRQFLRRLGTLVRVRNLHHEGVVRVGAGGDVLGGVQSVPDFGTELVLLKVGVVFF